MTLQTRQMNYISSRQAKRFSEDESEEIFTTLNPVTPMSLQDKISP